MCTYIDNAVYWKGVFSSTVGGLHCNIQSVGKPQTSVMHVEMQGDWQVLGISQGGKPPAPKTTPCKYMSAVQTYERV